MMHLTTSIQALAGCWRARLQGPCRSRLLTILLSWVSTDLGTQETLNNVSNEKIWIETSNLSHRIHQGTKNVPEKRLGVEMHLVKGKNLRAPLIEPGLTCVLYKPAN